jgi:hypothetical protein
MAFKLKEHWPLPDGTLQEIGRQFPRLTRDEALDAIEWWNLSRRQKHGRSAVWTERAFSMSLKRLAREGEVTRRAMLDGGLEHGWQTLKPEYVSAARSQVVGTWPM